MLVRMSRPTSTVRHEGPLAIAKLRLDRHRRGVPAWSWWPSVAGDDPAKRGRDYCRIYVGNSSAYPAEGRISLSFVADEHLGLAHAA